MEAPSEAEGRTLLAHKLELEAKLTELMLLESYEQEPAPNENHGNLLAYLAQKSPGGNQPLSGKSLQEAITAISRQLRIVNEHYERFNAARGAWEKLQAQGQWEKLQAQGQKA